jgi:hypothetical protein
MSAFEVDKTHIDVMVSAALQRIHGDTLKWYHGEIPDTMPGEALPAAERYQLYLDALKAAERTVTRDNAGMWGALLVAENRKSVNHRYDESEWEEPYEFTEYAGTFNPVAILKAINCYEYQACEHPEWKTSEARSFCEALTARMIHMLPGYGNAAYEVTDASQVTIGQATKVRRHLAA